jgi:hypothetical protein
MTRRGLRRATADDLPAIRAVIERRAEDGYRRIYMEKPLTGKDGSHGAWRS